MKVIGMIVEYDPLHAGHIYLIRQIRRVLGTDDAIICVMSGNFVQRGDFAVLGRLARAGAAVRSGVDLVLELPLPWAVSSAERFADGGVQILKATGLATHLAFGSECGDVEALLEVAACLNSERYEAGLHRLLNKGMPFAACRQTAAAELLGQEKAALLRSPNNNLGVEYCRALLRHSSTIRPFTVRRTGAAHGETGGRYPSSSAIRTLLREGRRDMALSLMAPAMAEVYQREEAAGRAPVLVSACERAILARLRTMTEAEFAVLDEGQEGLYRRLYGASRTACSLEELLNTAKTKRYAYARLRRMVLWAYLGLTPKTFPKQIPYLRVLAANGTGCRLLSQMRRRAVLLTKPASVRRLGGDAWKLFAQEAQAADLYALAYPRLSAAAGGAAWREGPVIL